MNGWRLISVVRPGLYRFEKCKPEDVIYQLDYNREGLEHKEEYIQMFRDCGWEYIMDMAGYSYFRKPVSAMRGEEEIFCDDASKLEFAGRVFRGKILPMLVVFCVLLFPLMILLRQGESPILRYFLGVMVGLFSVYLGVFMKYIVQYAALKRRIGGCLFKE